MTPFNITTLGIDEGARNRSREKGGGDTKVKELRMIEEALHVDILSRKDPDMASRVRNDPTEAETTDKEIAVQSDHRLQDSQELDPPLSHVGMEPLLGFRAPETSDVPDKAIHKEHGKGQPDRFLSDLRGTSRSFRFLGSVMAVSREPPSDIRPSADSEKRPQSI